MTDLISPLLQWLNTHPELSGLVTFIISAAESIAIIGTIIPGTIMMTALGMLAGAGIIPFWPTMIWAILGAIVGDGISYWFGYYFKDHLSAIWPFRSYPGILKKGERFFEKYGSMSVFIGRFVGPVRSLVPLVAGMLGLKPWQFTIANVLSAIGWAPAYMLPGILLGAASLELPPDIAIHVMLVLLLITLFVLLCLWFLYKLYQLIQTRVYHMQDRIWQYCKNSRYLAPFTRLVQDSDATPIPHPLDLVFKCLLVLALFFCFCAYIKSIGGASHLMLNQVSFHFFRGIRHPDVDSPMLCLTLLAQAEVILPLVVTLFIWLLLCKRFRLACHIALLGFLAAGGVFVMKKWVQSLRPWGILHSPETYSMPSGHTVLSTTLFLAVTFLLTRSMTPKWRYFAYSCCVLLLLCIAISRLYLGAHWLTDVLSGWLLSAGILMFVLILYRRKPEHPVSPWGLMLVTLGTLCITYTFDYHRAFSAFQNNYAMVHRPDVQINEKMWWQKNDVLDTMRTSLFGLPTQLINIEWAGDFDAIKTTLIDNGWQKAPSRDLISTLHRIADVRSAQYLPMISPQYLDKRPDLVLTQLFTDNKSLVVLRLWQSRFSMQGTKTSLWIGTIGVVPTTYSWIYVPRKKKNASELDQEAITYLFLHQLDLKQWQQKVVTVPIKTKKHTIAHQVMLLRLKETNHHDTRTH